MTHYAFATSLMNLMLVPTNMISGPLAEWLGFSSFFLVVMFASVPSAWAAFKAPFPLRDAEIKRQREGENEITITVDDRTELTPAQREVQRLAGRASIFAMLSILVVLVFDSHFLGSLREAEAHSSWRVVYLVVLVGFAVLKGALILFAVRAVKDAKDAAARAGDTVYVRNARGALWAAWISAAVSVAVLALAAALTF
jgi:PAT family beta-lactamase induction signal transducer AmpG